MDFVTQRLHLTPRTLADLDASYDLDQQPGVLDHVAGPWHDRQAHRAFIRQRIEQDFGPGLGYWCIATQEAPEEFLGWVLLIPVDAVGPDIEIGWRLHPKAWGQGYATEAARALLDHAFTELELDRVIADIMPANQASQRVAEKLGLRPTSTNDQGCQRYELLRSQYLSP